MNVCLKLLSPIYPISCHCPICGKPTVQGEAAIRLVVLDPDLDSEPDKNEILLLRAEKRIPCCETMLVVPEVFPTAREALAMIDDIENSLNKGDDPYIGACSAYLFMPNITTK